MKTLLVLRHAKAEQAEPGQLDFDRDLAKRGKQDAERVGHVLVERGQIPQAVIASNARRTRKTAKRVLEACNLTLEPTLTEDLYEAGVHDIVQVVQSLPPDADLALIVGHNPGFGDFVYTFGRQISDFPTAALAELRLPIDLWSDLNGTTRGELVSLWTPEADART